MSIRRILPITDPMLQEKSIVVHDIDGEVRSLATDMLETMQDADGAGLAAVQIGVLKRLLVADVLADTPWAGQKVFINPAITWASDEKQEFEGEGCLSMPEFYFPVPRAREVKVAFLDLEGSKHEIHVHGFAAVCFQHEIDHLDGIRQFDRASELKRAMLLRKFRKALRRGGYGEKLKRSA